ncbi:hypothetical protein RclHR1_00410048 [Rhizophagus clarus]|uniref:Uncharacterized protein n=1 Tax=Rhizophagus clarus TaxID=94130 RepID=A0A2Z6RGX8_9GLOM|nr:hypothetical protein RclHR1_00410048 [Rhizophagus clarus]
MFSRNTKGIPYIGRNNSLPPYIQNLTAEQPLSIQSLLPMILSKNSSNNANQQSHLSNFPVSQTRSSVPTSIQANPSANTARKKIQTVNNTDASSNQPAEDPPSGSPDIPPNPSPHDLVLQKLLGNKMNDLWTIKHDICSPYDCSKNFLELITLLNLRTYGCEFRYFIYNNLRIVPKINKRDFTSNGKLQYDWGPYSIFPSIYDPRITNITKFFIRIETISLSGIFSETPPLGGTYGPFSMVLGNSTERDTNKFSSIATKIILWRWYYSPFV